MRLARDATVAQDLHLFVSGGWPRFLSDSRPLQSADRIVIGNAKYDSDAREGIGGTSCLSFFSPDPSLTYIY